MYESQNAKNKTSPILRNPSKSMLFGTVAGIIAGSVVGFLMGMTSESNDHPPNPLFEKLTALVGSRFLAVFLLSAGAFGLFGFIMTLGLWVIARVQSKN